MAIYKVEWDTNEEQVELPKEVSVPDEVLPDDVADWLSNRYGWCISELERVKHQCSRQELTWEKEPLKDGDIIFYRGICPTCSKAWELVFVEVIHGLWDVENNKYVNI